MRQQLLGNHENPLRFQVVRYNNNNKYHSDLFIYFRLYYEEIFQFDLLSSIWNLKNSSLAYTFVFYKKVVYKKARATEAKKNKKV